MIYRISVAVLAVILLPIAVTALAQEAPGDRNALIRLESRVFDLGTDVRRMRRDPHFIPVTDVDWINTLLDADPYLRYTVIHINSFADSLGTPVWPPDEDREQYAPAKELARAWGLEDYDVHWQRRVAPSNRGDIILFPKAPNAVHYVSCAYDRADPVPTFCAALALYPPNPDLRIKVRIYKITEPINDFATIVERARSLVYCLDVTRALDAGTWQPLEGDKFRTLREFLSACKSILS